MPFFLTHPKGKWLLALLAALALCATACGQPAPTPVPPADPTIAQLMGDTNIRQLQERISATRDTWSRYSAWGKELVEKGYVDQPPVGPAPSPKLSANFTCINCHNTAREDPNLAVQDPDARLQYISQVNPRLKLAQGTTFWGMTDRVAFYNEYYAQYHGLCAPLVTTNIQIATGGPDAQGNCARGTHKMNPASLEDALQICSAYCSQGRYMLRWELDAVMAYLYDLQVHLSDVQLTADEKKEILAALLPPAADASRVNAARQLLATRYLRRAGDTYRGLPALADNGSSRTVTVGAYPDGATFQGDAARGKSVYAAACAQCHGTQIVQFKDAALISDVHKYYEALAKGIQASTTPYMPEFTLQRLSGQQAADVQAYLQSLP